MLTTRLRYLVKIKQVNFLIRIRIREKKPINSKKIGCTLCSLCVQNWNVVRQLALRYVYSVKCVIFQLSWIILGISYMEARCVITVHQKMVSVIIERARHTLRILINNVEQKKSNIACKKLVHFLIYIFHSFSLIAIKWCEQKIISFWYLQLNLDTMKSLPWRRLKRPTIKIVNCQKIRLIHSLSIDTDNVKY